MFKYLRRIGAHSQAPEIEYMPIQDDTTIPKGSLCELHDGYLVSNFNYAKSKFVSIEDKEKDDGKTAVACIRILPGMIFETMFIGEPENISAGSCISPVSSADGCYKSCDASEGFVEVLDCSECTETGKIIVTING